MEKKMFSQEEVEEIKKQAMIDSNKQMILEFAKKFDNIVSNNLVSSNKKNVFSNKFNQETVTRYLEDPIANEQNLRKLSTVLMTLSPQYQQIMNYLSSISKYIGVVKPVISKFTTKGKVDKEKLEKEYSKATFELEKLNIGHEFQRITSIIVREDIFYGYIRESENSFYIQQLDSDYCRISSISDGCFNIQFNFAYFDSNKNIKGMDVSLIETYPKEFQDKYKLYLKNRGDYQWQELNEENTISIKWMEDLPFVFAPYSSLFNDLSDLNDYKDLAKSKAEIDNYKFIGMQIPLNQSSGKPNDFLVDSDVAMMFYNMLLNSLPEGIGAFITPTDFEDINFGGGNSSTDVSNKVKEAEDNIFSGSGVSSINFGKGTTSSSGITASNSVDSARLFKLYRQFERWLNRRFKRLYKDEFVVKLLDVTQHNFDEVVDRYLKLAQYGVPVKLELSALIGVSQCLERGSTFLENEVLNLHEQWLPLMSSHTMTMEGDGSNEKKASELTDNGEKTRDNK